MNITISTTANSKDVSRRSFSGTYVMPDSAEACIALWTDLVTLSQIAQRIKGRLRHRVQIMLEKGKTDADILEMLSTYVPSLRESAEESEEESEAKLAAREKDPVKKAARYLSLLAKLNPEG